MARTPRHLWTTVSMALSLLLASCFEVRVPIVDIEANFRIADVTWFEEEQTLFIFWRVDARQGLSPESQIELSYRTDEVDQDFIDVAELDPIHTHFAADCGEHTICGSQTVRVELLPRAVQLRLRYHRDGEVFLDAPVEFHVVTPGSPHLNRSAVLYGVFDELNTLMQWRLRHQFPGIRNQQAQALGLRRFFRVQEAGYGARPFTDFDTNPYGYGIEPAGCPGAFVPLGHATVNTDERAVWDPVELPLESSTFAQVCALGTVTDALGEFRTTVFAQKNPETRAAFPALRSPITEATALPFFLEICNEATNVDHRAMQQQRTFTTDSDVECVDDFAEPGFEDRIAAMLQTRVNEERPNGNDMVLVLALNRPDNRDVAAPLERALAQLVVDERDQPSPRLAGVYVFDSRSHAIRDPDVSRVVLWCPSNLNAVDLDTVNDVSLRSCAAVPQIFELDLGALQFSTLPIQPTRRQFDTFVERYGVAQAGRVTELTFRTPERTAISENVPVGDFGLATFFNNEAIGVELDDAFSFCALDIGGVVLFRIPGGPPEPLPIAIIPDVQLAFPQTRYELGLFWDFPYLLELQYETTLAGAAPLGPIDFSVQFGVTTPATDFFGLESWKQESFDLREVLEQCDRFCDHPTFDSAGTYSVLERFRNSYLQRCYRPRFPLIDDDNGFPIDP